MKRLIAEDYYDINYYDGSSYPVGITLPNYENTFVNNNITKVKYTPDIDRTYKIFEEPYENTEMFLTAEMEDLIAMSNEKWVRAFAQALKNEKVQPTDIKDYKVTSKRKKEVTSEINVKDLPKIIWNEEEYRVLFNTDGKAEILNNFGNHVLTLEDTYTVKQVNEQLADREIVPEDYRQDDVVIEFQNQETTQEPLYKDTHSILSNKDYNGTMETQEAHYNMPHYGADPNYLGEEESHLVQDFSDIELEEEDIEMFQNGICPYCQEGHIKLINDKDELWVFECDECDATYTVEPESGDIKIKSIEASIVDENIELLNKTLFIEEMNKKGYNTDLTDILTKHIDFEGANYEITVNLRDDYVVSIISYLNNEVIDIPDEIYEVVLSDIEESNIE